MTPQLIELPVAERVTFHVVARDPARPFDVDYLPRGTPALFPLLIRNETLRAAQPPLVDLLPGEALGVAFAPGASKALSVLQSLPLERVSVVTAMGCGLRDEGLAPLDLAVNLRSLALAGNAITGRGLRALSHAHGLRILVLRSNPLTDEAFPSLARCPLEVVWVSGSEVTGTTLDALAGAGTLTSLIVQESSVNDETAAAIASITSLRELILTDASITRTAVPRLARLGALRSLDLSGTAIDGRSLVEASRAWPHLQVLTVARTAVGAEIERAFDAWPELHTIAAEHTAVDDATKERWRAERGLVVDGVG